MDALSWPQLPFLAAGLVAVLAYLWARNRYQRCPHCRRLVKRAHRGWLRCRGCGRQYHRSVMLKR